jgi:DNA-binding NarL/FixJ family response regulator
MTPGEHLTPKEVQIAILVWQGLTNREIGKIMGTSEQVIKNHLRSTFDKLGVWSRGWSSPYTWLVTAAKAGPPLSAHSGRELGPAMGP